MLFWVIIKVCLKSLLANKMRTILAMLGIIIGVGAVIAMLAIGAGARQRTMSSIAAFGTNVMSVRPGQNSSHGVVSGTAQNLTVADALSLPREAQGVRRVSPTVSNRCQVKYMSKNTRVNTTGVSVTYLPIRNFEVEKGRCFTEAEVEGMTRVAIIGPQTADNLFENVDPVGQTVKINSINFTIIGITRSKGDMGFVNFDDLVLIPYTTAMKQLFGLEYLNGIDIQGEDGSDMTAVQENVTALLRKRHRLAEDAPDDFSIRNQADFIRFADEQNLQFTVLLGSIASISLLVGGIGIMNIMLVSVTERTREIGIRKAIGAKQSNILWQFLIEAIFISGLGGLIGVAFGVGASAIVGRFPMFTTVVQPYSIVLSISFSGIVGVFFGLYPAWRAASLDPIEALRYE